MLTILSLPRMLGLASLAVSLAIPVVAIERPTIWVQRSDREAILEKIENHDWAARLYTELKDRSDALVCFGQQDSALVTAEFLDRDEESLCALGAKPRK